jgi:WD40 repeat protein
VVTVWNTVTGQETLALTGHTGWVWSVAWSADGRRLASGGEDGAVGVWDTSPSAAVGVSRLRSALTGWEWAVLTGWPRR